MAIDARHEDVFPLTDAYKRAEPLIGKRLAQSTFYRWSGKGVKGVRLETRMLGGTRYTSLEAIQRFFDALTEVTDAHRSAPMATEPTRNRQAEIDQAHKECDEYFGPHGKAEAFDNETKQAVREMEEDGI